MAQPRPRPARDHGSAPQSPEGAQSGGAATLEEIAGVLAAAREQAMRDLAGLTGDYDDLVTASQLSNADDEHDPEGATIASERSQLDALVRAAQDRLVEIDAAVARLEEGRYGICMVCERPIARARLEARPVARTCIDCAARPT